MEKVYTNKAPEALGPYTQAMISGGLVFTSGQIAIDPATGSVDAVTIEEQTEQVCKNLSEVLKQAGSSLEKAVKINNGFLDRLVGGNGLDEDKREIIKEARQEISETRIVQVIKAGK